jgi:enterochelin esterase-like enzyme
MRRRASLVAVALAWVALGVWGVESYASHYYTYRGFAPPQDPRGVEVGRGVTEWAYSPALRKREEYLIYLPPGYDRLSKAGKRFPVLYLLHGSPGFPALFVNAGNLGVALDRLIAARTIQPMLVVMPSGRRNGGFRDDTEWANTSQGRFEDYVLDVVRSVDATWPTIPDRAHRAIAGNSEGAYGAVNVALHHLRTFGTVESWSGYFRQSATGPFKHATPAQLASNSPAYYAWSLAGALRRHPLHVFLYTGRSDAGSRQVADFARELAAVGAHVRFALYPGHHEWRLWRAQMPRMLRYAGLRFRAGSAPPHRKRPQRPARIRRVSA